MNDAKETFSKLVMDALDRISKITTKRSILTYHTNIMRNESISELERERLVEAVIERLRAVAPNAATNIAGPKDSDARDFLQNTYNEIEKIYDLSGNTVGQGVKYGGDMIANRLYIDLYISYKAPSRWHVTLAWIQASLKEERFLRVRQYHKGQSNKESLSERDYPIGQEHDAIDHYKTALDKLISQGEP